VVEVVGVLLQKSCVARAAENGAFSLDYGIILHAAYHIAAKLACSMGNGHSISARCLLDISIITNKKNLFRMDGGSCIAKGRRPN